MNLTQTFIILTFLVCLGFTYTNDHPKCAHHLHEYTPELLDVQEEPLLDQTRTLQTGYPNIRIYADYSMLVNGTDEFKNYVKVQLFPPVLDYFRAALTVKQPLTSPLMLPSYITSICGFQTPQTLLTGVNTDLYMMVSSSQDNENWVASAGPCYLASGSKRPLIGKMLFNMVYAKAATGDVLNHEKNMYLTIHEMIHALGFSGSSFLNFIDAYGQPLQNQIKTVLLNGSNRTVLDVEPLTSKLRAHFGCSTLPGAFMENDGGTGTAGSHFERRHFLYETMTSGVIHGRRVSQFSFAVLEGSGWYMPNYTYAEPFYAGQGEGCGYLYQDCASPTIFNYDEFCAGNGRGCTAVGRGGGICSTDTRSDGCSYYIPVIDYDCENQYGVDNARLPNQEVYGRGLGSRCFNGNLTTLSSSSQTSFCFKFDCIGSGLTTTLNVTIGSNKVTCKAEGQLKVSGYNGALYCPDPLTYCSTVGKKYCPRGCMGRGVCVNNQCQCNAGSTGIDCALIA